MFEDHDVDDEDGFGGEDQAPAQQNNNTLFHRSLSHDQENETIFLKSPLSSSAADVTGLGSLQSHQQPVRQREPNNTNS